MPKVFKHPLPTSHMLIISQITFLVWFLFLQPMCIHVFFFFPFFFFFFLISKPAEFFYAGLQSKQLGEDIWMGVMLLPAVAESIGEPGGCLRDMDRTCSPVWLSWVSCVLKGSWVWGQLQYTGVTEMAANLVISAWSSEVNRGIQVELCPCLFHDIFTVPCSPGWVLLQDRKVQAWT